MLEANMEIGKLVITEGGKITIEMLPNIEVFRWLFTTLVAPSDLKNGTKAPALPTSSELRSSKRGRPTKTAMLETGGSSIDKKRVKKSQTRLPIFRPGPAQQRKIESILYDIKESVDHYWRLDTTSRKPESLSNTYKQLIEAYYHTTPYRASRKATLGKIDAKQTIVNMMIRDGVGENFLSFVRSQVRILSAEVIRV
ncbi:hypothetical protein [Paenibacillus sp. SI8]|uniref:hypothetical protein n=1 Tax=unclassified Paenibacillus TaxID=185978 RepID=UPI003466722C